MGNVFVISDTHFHHANILTFLNRQDDPKSLVRPEFQTVEEMDEFMVAKWNETVKPGDKVYHLGDVTMNRSTTGLDIMKRLNGTKVLIKGNHDKAQLSAYAKHFKDVRASHRLADCILTHIPIHPDDFGGRVAKLCVHGHTHCHKVVKVGTKDVLDIRYFNACVENWNYTPIALETIQAYIHTHDAELTVYDDKHHR